MGKKKTVRLSLACSLTRSLFFHRFFFLLLLHQRPLPLNGSLPRLAFPMTPVAERDTSASTGKGGNATGASGKEAMAMMMTTTGKPQPPPPPPPSSRHARLVVLAGPCGSGKTTVGRALSALMGSAVPFLDADDYHDAAAKSKMSQGEALDEGDRVPWLERVAAAAREAAVFSPSHVAVLACSALKKKYRDLIVEVANEAEVPSVAVDFVLLKATRDSLRTRLERRQEIMQKSSGACEEVAGHFLHPSLLDSQLESWEDSAEVVVVENDGGGNDEGGSGSGGGREDEAAATRRAAEAVLKAVGLEKGKL